MPNSEEKTSFDASGKKIPLDSSGPYREETEPEVNAETLGTRHATPHRQEGSLGEKDDTDTEGTNPKRTENSKRD